MVNSRELYVNTKPGKLFFKVAIPGAISMLATMIYFVFEGMFVGQVLGDTAFAAVNLAMPFVIVNFSLADLIGVGSAVPISIHLGRKEEDEANNYFTSSILMIFFTGCFMGALLYFGAAPLMSFMGAEGELKRLAAEYLQVYALCAPLSTMTFAVDNYLRICGKVKTSMILNVAMSFATVVLDYVFLFVLGLGVWSAALAASGAMILCTVAAMIPFFLGKLQLKFTKPRFSFRLIKQVVTSGSPIFLSNVAGRIASIVMNIALLSLGGEVAVTIFGVMMYGGDLLQPLIYGICDSLQPAIGYNYGANEQKRVKSIEKWVLAAGAVVSFAFVFLMMLIPQHIAAIFLQKEETELILASARVIRIYSLTFLTRWFAFAVQSLFVALDRPVPATLLSILNALVFPVILIAMLWRLGLDGLWFNAPLTSLLVAIVAGVLLFVLRKKLLVCSNCRTK